MVGRTTQGRTYYGIKFTIYSTVLLHFEEEYITTINIELQKIESVYDKRQDNITLNRESN